MGTDECSRELEFKMWAGSRGKVMVGGYCGKYGARVYQFGKIGYVEVD